MGETKDPREVSGWGPGNKAQDFSDIAKHSEKNAEFDPKIGHVTEEPRGKPPVRNEPAAGRPRDLF